MANVADLANGNDLPNGQASARAEVARLWRGFWQLADPQIWVASTVPMVVGAAMAWGLRGMFNPHWFAACLVGIYLFEIGKNAINEVVDYEYGPDRFVTKETRTPFSGGKKTIVDGLLTVGEATLIAVFTMLGGAAVGLYIAFYREMGALPIGLAGFFLATFYSLPPIKLAYRGGGEVAVGLSFGPLLLAGTYLVLTGEISMVPLVAGLSLGFLIANVLWINQYPDYEADRRGRKQNWVVRLGRHRGVKVYTLIYAAAYLSVIALALVGQSWLWLLPLGSLPLALRSVRVAQQHYDDIPRLLEANMKTVQTYQLTGLLMSIAALLQRAL